MTNATVQPARRAKPPPKQLGPIGEMIEIIKTVFYALLIAFVLRVALFQPFTIPSASDEPNLYRGDYIIVTKWSYGWSQKSVPFLDYFQNFLPGRLFFQAPKRGDIVVFKLPHDGHTDFIKRLIGLPGDRIQMKGGQLFINDKPVVEQSAYLPPPPVGIVEEGIRGQYEVNPEGRRYLTQVQDTRSSAANNTGVYVVPPHCYFMMGDNRDDSLDSRFDPKLLPGDVNLGGCGLNAPFLPSDGEDEAGVGFVPEDNLVGRASLVLLSWNTGVDAHNPCCASLFKPWTWFTDARPDRFFKIIH